MFFVGGEGWRRERIVRRLEFAEDVVGRRMLPCSGVRLRLKIVRSRWWGRKFPQVGLRTGSSGLRREDRLFGEGCAWVAEG